MSEEDPAGRLGAFYTPLVSDICDELGLRSGVLPRSMQAVVDDPHRVVAGTAFCCRVEPTDEYVEIDEILAMVDAIPHGSFVLVASEQPVDAALWGGLMSARAQSRGAVAAATTGPVRDVSQIASLGFPVYANGRNMQDIRRRGRMVAYGTDVTIGEVTIRTGDALVADANGIIAVSSDDLPTVLERLEAGADDESAVQEGLAEGKSAVAMFRERGRF